MLYKQKLYKVETFRVSFASKRKLRLFVISVRMQKADLFIAKSDNFCAGGAARLPLQEDQLHLKAAI